MTYGRIISNIHMKNRSTNPTYQHPFPERKPLRLSDYDYTQAGAYFVTICTQNRSCLFGTIVDGEMLLNEIGQIVEEQLHAIPKRFPQARLDEYIVMPNHIHAIITIVGAPLAGARNTDGVSGNSGNPVGAPLAGALNTNGAHVTDGASGNRATARVAPTTLGDIVGAYKSLCVHFCLAWARNHDNERLLGTLWQRNYWEHIIRDEPELHRIREYIRNNPLQWQHDTLHPTQR